MAWPTTAILDVLVEMQLSTGEYVDITSYCYGIPDSDEIGIQRGRSGEAFAIEPTEVTFKLKNDDGRFSYRNPRSPYYGLIGRNTPLKVSVRPRLTDITTGQADLADTFNRTVAAGDTWGTSDTGQTWTKSSASAANKLSVSSGTGRILMSTANTTVRAVLDQPSLYYDFDLYATFTSPVATGASLFPFILSMRRDTGGGNQGIFQVATTTAGAVVLEVLASSLALGASLGTATVSGLTHTGQALRVRVRLAGNVTMAKCWDASGAEPSSWQIIKTDTGGKVFPSGSIAIACTAPTGNTNVPFTAQYDNVSLTAIEPRAAVELTSLPVRWTKGAPTAGPVWIPVRAQSLLGRLQSTQELGKSALWKLIEANGTHLQGYWAMTQGVSAQTAGFQYSPAVAGTPQVNRTPPGTGYAGGVVSLFGTAGDGTLAGWLENGTTVVSNGFLIVDRPNVPDNAGAGWSFDWVRRGGLNTTGSGEVIFVNLDSTDLWAVNFIPGTGNVSVAYNNVTLSSVATTATIYDDLAHHYRLTVTKAGSTLNYNLYIDGSSETSGSVAAATSSGAGKIKEIDVENAATTVTLVYGQLAIWDTSPPDVTTTANAALGYPSETASDRIIRIATARSIPWYALADANEEVLGQQPIGTDYEVIAAAAAADRGVLADLRDVNGLLYYARNTLYHQTPLALTYSTDGHLQETPEPTDDDANVVNISTVTRQFSTSRTYEQTAGSLSTANPPAGLGRKTGDATLNLATDIRALHLAEWIVNQGTVDDSRWPALTVSLAHLARHSLFSLLADVMRLDAGFRLTVASPPSFLPPGTIDQLILGVSETLSQYKWLSVFNCGPYEVYRVGVWSGTAKTYKWDAGNSTLAADATSSATSLSVATSSGSLWTTSAGDFPFDINISGVRITVTSISGAASPQTFTVTRSVDGFDLALTAGASVRLWTSSKWGL